MSTVSELSERWLRRRLDTISHSQRRVLQSAFDQETIAKNTNEELAKQLSFGDKLADAVVRLGGSWGFIMGFMGFLIAWALINVVLLKQEAFDPYPFIFLNLLLSMLAAIQAPIIMMAQNRQASYDRIDAAHDYEINLKAEIEIMALHDKLDQLRNDQLVMVLGRIEQLAESIHRLERNTSRKWDSSAS